MNAVAKELLRVQKKQFEMALMWISLLESSDPLPGERKVIAEQYVKTLSSITELQMETLGIDLTQTILANG